MADGYSRASGRQGVVLGQNGTADPSNKRTRILSSYFSSVYKTRVAADSNYGVFGFLAGNEVQAQTLRENHAVQAAL